MRILPILLAMFFLVLCVFMLRPANAQDRFMTEEEVKMQAVPHLQGAT
jgi:hypothetical protein